MLKLTDEGDHVKIRTLPYLSQFSEPCIKDNDQPSMFSFRVSRVPRMRLFEMKGSYNRTFTPEDAPVSRAHHYFFRVATRVLGLNEQVRGR